MSRQRTMIGIATGVALLAAAGLLIAKKKKSGRKFTNGSGELAETYKSKLQNLQRRAKREYNEAMSQGSDLTERVGEMVKKAGSSIH
jgi:LPXTG-motif cell wall-anchored protein